MPGKNNLNIDLLKIGTNLNEAEAIWSRLAEQNNISYFLSWGWIESWLLGLPGDCDIHMAVVVRDKVPLLAFFIGFVSVKRSRFFNVRQLVLNASGHKEYDNIWLEYNRMLCAPGFAVELQDILQAIPLPWEEFLLPGLDPNTFPGTAVRSLPSSYQFIIDETAHSPYVDLEKVRQTGGDYLSLLSSNTRSGLRRSLRIAEENGPIELEVPNSLEQGLRIYHELIELHQTTWQQRDKPGVFSSDLFCHFHKRLIENRFAKGEIQLLRIHSADLTVGCLYNFVLNNKVYFYQSGFNYTFGKNMQPGVVSHYTAINYNTAIGNMTYDFLAGEARYKKSLATDSNEMVWGRIQRPLLKFKLENFILRFLLRIRGK